jgi:hypothetical protein
VHPAFQSPNLFLDFFDGRFVGLFDGQVEQDVTLFDFSLQFLEAFDLFGNARAFFENNPGVLGIVPEVGFRDLFFDFLQAVFLGGQVKDNLGAVRVSDPGLQWPVSVRLS